MQKSTSSLGSKRSLGKYHVVSHGSRVDESLFGDGVAERMKKSGSSVNGATLRGAGAGIATNGGRSSSSSSSAAAVPEAPAMIHADDLYKMQKQSEIETAEMLRHRLEDEARAKKERMSVAEARKEKIRSMESARIVALPKSFLEQEEEEQKAARRELAALMRDEAQDDIKKMNSILNYAITVTIRDRQVAEKKEREESEKAQDRMRDLQAEIEGLQRRKAAEEAEMAKKSVFDRVKNEMMEQLHESLGRKQREREQLKKDEAIRKANLAKAAAQEAKEKEDLAKKKQAILTGTIKHNEIAIAEKHARKLAEQELDRKVDEEAAEREKFKQAQEEQKALAKKAREEAEFKVRGAVSKFYDDTEKRQEMLMRRAYEEGERRAREKELLQARKAAETLAELHNTRVHMIEEKQASMAAMIDVERMEFERAHKMQAEWLEQERIKEETRNASNAVFLRDVRAQVDDKLAREKSVKARERLELEQQTKVKAAEIEYLRKLRDRKVEEMRALNLPVKYQQELLRYDPEATIFKAEMDRPPLPRKSESSPKK